jgi:hypothetical protein
VFGCPLLLDALMTGWAAAVLLLWLVSLVIWLFYFEGHCVCRDGRC